MPDLKSPFQQLGGEPVLRPLVERFVDLIFEDPMIGFLFRDADRRRVAQKEYEQAARHLGADVPYTGRPLAAAHAPHPISNGHFDRRRKILEEVLEEAGAPPGVRAAWLAEVDALRAVIVSDPRRCNVGAPGPG